jgi:hypothetical protein
VRIPISAQIVFGAMRDARLFWRIVHPLRPRAAFPG